jgi:hypothetical protein
VSPNLNETWTRDLYLPLVTNSTLGKEFEVQLGIYLLAPEDLNQN